MQTAPATTTLRIALALLLFAITGVPVMAQGTDWECGTPSAGPPPAVPSGFQGGAAGVYVVRAVMTPEASGAAHSFSQKLTVLR